MLFNSLVFIGAFLPVVLVGWYGLQRLENPIFAKLFLIGMSLFFYGYYNPKYVLLLLGSILFNYGCSLAFGRVQGRTSYRGILAIGLAGNIGLLFYFKYFNFFVENCNFLLHTDWQIEKIALPLGISYFTFQQIAFLVDRYRGTATHYGLVDYVCFATFFPQLISGPITMHHEFMPQLAARENRRLNIEQFYDGAVLFILGMGKKVLLADVLAIVVNAEYQGISWLDAPSAWVTIICYMLELYFDFSGYSDMARGIGKMLGFVLPENFNSPLMAVSVKDFWRRWHMTLSRFLTQYIYIPLGGNRKGIVRKCINLMVVFLVSGIWHGANWTFIVWGLMHGAAMVWESVFAKLRFKHDALNRLCTGLYVTLTFSVFRSDSLQQAWLLWQKLFTGGFKGFFKGLCNTLVIPETYVLRKGLEMLMPTLLNPFYIGCMLLLLGVSILLIAGPKAEAWIEGKGRSVKGMLIVAVIFLWAFLSLSRVSTFLYFDF